MQTISRSQAPVPFYDLRPSHAGLRDEVLDDIARTIDSGRFVNGPEVERFEDAFAAYCGTRACVGVASGLDALRLILIAASLEPGEEVVVPAMTFVATLEAITQAGGRPVIVDVSPADYCLDADAAKGAITSRTRFVLPVHLYGQMADVDALAEVVSAAGLTMVDDACQAHGATRAGERPGARSLAAAYSFYPAKNLGAFGDAGALVTNDEALAARVRALREHGQLAKYRHEYEGFTSRLDSIQAAVLLRKLARLDEWNHERRLVAARYTEALDGVGDLRLPPVPAESEPVWHLYVIRTQRPEELARHLAERQIQTGRHYPEPVHLSPAYEWLGHRKGEFPVAEALADECLSLPLFPGMADGQLERVTEAISDYFRGA